MEKNEMKQEQKHNNITFDSDNNTQMASKLIKCIGDDGSDISFPNETDMSCTVHRLCRYYSSPSKKENIEATATATSGEYIRSHTDWSILTLVPVSSVFGLEVWKNEKDGWIRPELLALRQYNEQTTRQLQRLQKQEQMTQTNENFDDIGTNDIQGDQWNSNYVVAMTGKWLEILSNGTIPSTVHRVVVSGYSGGNSDDYVERDTTRENSRDKEKEQKGATNETQQPCHNLHHHQRMSAPFFWRPRQRVPLDVQRVFNSKEADISFVENGEVGSNNIDISHQQHEIHNLNVSEKEMTLNMTELERKAISRMSDYLKFAYH
uniref:Isopenicillin N synthase-like Fe(2+) 2OG dioxygenase domain-containing protein n=1 Tax=Ditylum brightwellii TaxID=49249 RepID=A0A7S4RTP8_9STRA|mmetsp:Transcript_40812/g.61806  ORF Transcript_40812/g.61806 Transcript_40812/m.61806 type:complete len:320 (+) Transcript_40812:137-1096(+)